MTRADLYREYARVIEMCDASKLPANSVLSCVRVSGKKDFDFEELQMYLHGFAVSSFIFALFILENKPVFAGDKLFYNGYELTVTGMRDGRVLFNWELGDDVLNLEFALCNFSWNPPIPKTRRIRIYSDEICMMDFNLVRGDTAVGPMNVIYSDMEFIVRWKK
jgi:hypothetical protein